MIVIKKTTGGLLIDTDMQCSNPKLNDRGEKLCNIPKFH